MAVDVYTSPRLSFSHDLTDPEPESLDPTRPEDLLLSPTFDFDFRTSNLTPADELFSNGKILPTQIKYPGNPDNNIQNPDNKTKKRLKELIQDQDPDPDPDQEPGNPSPSPPTPKSSFWQFRRSASLNCDNSKTTKGLFGSLSIKSLARSNSTGSALNPKPNSGQKTVEKYKESMFLRRCSSLTQPVHASTSSHVYYSFRNSGKESRTGIKIIPILNVPPAYNISKGTINFFGFGFCNGKIKKKTRS